MRIRKNASRILGSSAAARPLLLPPPKPAPELLHKCELNQSPWDVMSFPLPPSSPQKMGNDGLEEDTSVKTTKTKRKRAVKRKSTVIKEEATDHNQEARAAVPTCKKMDGKKWKCKKAAKLPHTLCEYHLTQLKSYSRVDDVPPARDRRPRSKKRQKVSSAAAGSDSGYYYYYSGFGPWRGKKRGSDGGTSGASDRGSMNVAVKEEAREDDEKEEEEQVHVQEVADDDDEDSLDEQSEEEEAMQQQQQQQQLISNPRRRRRRKARSLKSLL